MKKSNISNNVIRRLPRYLRKLDELSDKGILRVSSFELGEQLGFTPSQIRQDFSCFGEFGQQGYGYNVQALKTSIGKILGTDQGNKAILIGVGHIGRALMENFSFKECGFTLERAFDVKESVVGQSINGVLISPMQEISRYLSENHVDIAVLSVPKEVAIEVSKNLTENGIKAIWNFTNVELTEPNSPIIVENVHFSDSLLALSYFVSEEKDSTDV